MDECIFCKIARDELPAFKVHETDTVLAFLDIHPVNPGHTLVIPKQHSTNIFDVAPEDWAAVAEGARAVAIAIEKGLAPDGVNLMMNNREHAGQVIDHPHIHVIPRFKGDGLTLWKHGEYKEGEAESIKGKIVSAI